jgi:DNA-binding response OmpR family regulator
MTIDSGSHRTVSAASAALVGVEVLVLDADERVHAGVAQLLGEHGLHVTSAEDASRALALIDKQFFSVALIDIDTPAPRAGIATIAALKAKSPTTMIIALTPRRSYEDAVDAVRAGAVDLILKAPESVAYLKDRVAAAAGRSVGRREVDSVLADVRKVHDEFLERFMDAERRALDADDIVPAMDKARPKGFAFIHASSGGEALDRISRLEFHYAMIAEDVSDLSARTIAKTIRTQRPDTVVLTFKGPADNGHVNLVDATGSRAILKPFNDPTQLIGRLDELAAAWRAKSKERRYTQAFREKHYDFLRTYVELKTKIERAMTDGG